ncbi:hypothetical protein HK102_012070 [Quaeritorhiza haematococci]|nr:hypothetical protein HK102_012070 [Quaeritorhiza haematococci]
MVTTALEPPPKKSDGSAFIYFMITVSLTLVSFCGYLLLVTFFEKYYKDRAYQKVSTTEEALFDDVDVEDDPEDLVVEEDISQTQPLLSGVRVDTGADAEVSGAATNHKLIVISEDSLQILLPQIKTFVIAIFLNFFVTLSMFPSITSSIGSVRSNADLGTIGGSPSLSSRIFGDLFIPIHFLVFNIADLVGKALPGWRPAFIQSGRTLLLFSISRAILGLSFLLCNVRFMDRFGAPLPRKLPLVFGDAAYLVVLFLFALTNGWIGTNALMQAPRAAMQSRGHGGGRRGSAGSVVTGEGLVGARESVGQGREIAVVEDARLGQRVGDVMVFALATGLVGGSFLSFAFRGALCSCNPFVSS